MCVGCCCLCAGSSIEAFDRQRHSAGPDPCIDAPVECSNHQCGQVGQTNHRLGPAVGTLFAHCLLSTLLLRYCHSYCHATATDRQITTNCSQCQTHSSAMQCRQRQLAACCKHEATAAGARWLLLSPPAPHLLLLLLSPPAPLLLLPLLLL